MYEPAWWGKGITGIAEFTFPHPEGWTLGDAREPLHKLTVRALTRLFRSQDEETPTCVSSWEKKLGRLDWDKIKAIYASPALTPRDWASHFKNVLHRAFFSRRINKDAPNPRCRCCGRELESLMHFTSCRPAMTNRAGGG